MRTVIMAKDRRYIRFTQSDTQGLVHKCTVDVFVANGLGNYNIASMKEYSTKDANQYYKNLIKHGYNQVSKIGAYPVVTVHTKGEIR